MPARGRDWLEDSSSPEKKVKWRGSPWHWGKRKQPATEAMRPSNREAPKFTEVLHATHAVIVEKNHPARKGGYRKRHYFQVEKGGLLSF